MYGFNKNGSKCKNHLHVTKPARDYGEEERQSDGPCYTTGEKDDYNSSPGFLQGT